MQDFTLKDVYRIMLNRIWLVVVLPFIALMVSTIVVYFFIQPTYTAITTMYVLNKQNNDANTVNYADLQSSQLLTADYRELALSKRVLTAVANELGLSTSNLASDYGITITSANNTRVIQISATASDPLLASSLANAIGREFSVCVVEIMDVNNVSVVDAAVPPSVPSAPKKMQTIAIATFAGLILAIGIALLIEMFNTSIRSGEDIEKVLELALLAKIPKVKLT